MAELEYVPPAASAEASLKGSGLRDEHELPQKTGSQPLPPDSSGEHDSSIDGESKVYMDVSPTATTPDPDPLRQEAKDFSSQTADNLEQTETVVAIENTDAEEPNPDSGVTALEPHEGAEGFAHNESEIAKSPSPEDDTATDLFQARASTFDVRTRSDSRSTVATQNAQRSTPISSAVFILTALDTIGSSKDARRSKELEEAVAKARANIKQCDEQPIDPEAIFAPLQLATKTLSIPLQVTALDCIGKLITYSYFAFPSIPASGEDPQAPPDQLPLIERAIETICSCFENESTPPEIQQQIIKSLLAAVLNDKIVVHGAGLLKAVRQIYNIFIYSKSSQNQQIAQGSLTQMVGNVYDRVRVRLDLKETQIRDREDHGGSSPAPDSISQANGDLRSEQDSSSEASQPVPDQPVAKDLTEKLTLQSFETNKDTLLVNDNAPTMVTRAKVSRKREKSVSGDEGDSFADDDVDEIYVKDAFLVFRALCKLSHKALSHEQQLDIKSQNMRSKLLSLHLIQHLLSNHIAVFTSPLSTLKHSSNSSDSMTLLEAVKPHLCLSLSRNGASSVPRVFEVGCEIFWLMLKHMRVMLKKEIEVFLKEIYLAILEKRNSPMFQKLYFMDILERLSADPRALVEIYLNYDCDRTALENIFQGIIEHLSRQSSTPITVTAMQEQQYQEHSKSQSPNNDWHQKGTLPPSLSTAKMGSGTPTGTQSIPQEYVLKQRALECLVQILRSLDVWSSRKLEEQNPTRRELQSRSSIGGSRESLDTSSIFLAPSPNTESGDLTPGQSAPILDDDPNQIEKVKQRKIALTNAIKQFNFKPKRGIKALLSEGFIRSNSPVDIANFLIRNDRLDKATLGEYLGEGDAENIAIMHAFVDCMDFKKRRFVDALRQFLQSFRLPGESQKIDRFMLKFAERYLTGNPNAFATADAAYVLAYSVILLNTDLHSTKMKGRRMTKQDFINNNRGINDNSDLPEEYLSGIYDEIANNEIVLNTERENAANLGIPTQPQPGLATRAGQVLATVGRDVQGERYAQASEEIANKTEQLYRSLIRAQRKSAIKEALSRFIPATSARHVGSMFNVTWMSFLSGLSAHVQDTQQLDTIRLCMEGIRLSIRIACRFDLETPRVAFVTVLAKFTNLGNLREMMAKNMEALKVLLDVAITEGNHLKESWREILTCISQLDRFQLLTDGVDEGALPDVSMARLTPPSTADASRARKSSQAHRRPRPRSMQNANAHYRVEVAMESRSTEMIRGVDRIFTNTANLSNDAIVDFVRALSHVSWQEIQSSGQSDSPRTYSLQKVVEISYYNMTRVRIEWSRIWEILGEHFNQVGCHTNTAVVFFALDSLRQLSMQFMELGELPGFKFQKDFLKPFEHVMAHSTTVTVKDMVLRCLIQMIQARGDNIRSGWRTMFGVFSVAAREPYEGIVSMAFEHVLQVYTTRFGVIITQGAFADLIVCLTDFSKNLKFQKKSLQAIETLKSTIPKMLKTPECPLYQRRPGEEGADIPTQPLQPSRHSAEEQFWYPVLIAFQDVLMTGDDLEVRSRALNYLFETLIRFGGDFPPEFWDILWRQLLYPIFIVLQSKSEMSKVPNHEELSVWLSTTMIQALRNMITLFTHYFDSLEYMLDRFLELLTLCICQENDTIARIGSNCLQQLILQNVSKFQEKHWTKIVGAFVELFEKTTAHELFTATTTAPFQESETQKRNAENAASEESADKTVNEELSSTSMPTKANGNTHFDGESHDAEDSQLNPGQLPPAASSELEDYRPQSQMGQPPAIVTVARRRFFNGIITNCVLQLLMIETVHELFSNDAVYAQIPSQELLRLMALLKKSYQFAKKFNEAKDLRVQLWRQGFMKQPPNLLKQESGSAATYVNILFRMYHDEGDERRNSRAETEAALIPLCADIIGGYAHLDEETQQRNIVAWRPVVVDVMEGYTGMPRETFEKHIETFYPICIDLLGRDLNNDVRLALYSFLRRVGECRLGMPPYIPPETPSSPRSFTSQHYFNGSRRRSKGR
ncbi:guanyl-nucleotide exchange factor [Histoplasma capsulatum var. duboisii H88]|uniref:Guanyl-nucleotide exchange factor n=1 Tax=Ajellomyces capsulatus (strain H88) TaxID=544711 RepID=F0UK70_AJEC8|nr:guanyl-nucleotide exchange factor [Histoplasma capsulatum var. duboisii H88]QSS57335.1 protein transporter SEC7 [Histoplasma capsulatum var. duboisii H88]